MPFTKGCIPWNKGKEAGDQLTEDGRQRISESSSRRWDDEDWAVQQRQRLSKKVGQQKRGPKVGTTWTTGRPAWNRKEHLIRECLREGCTNMIDTPPSLSRIRFCSTSCQASTTNIGLKHPNNKGKWQDWDGQPYDKNWPKIRVAINDRDKCCQVCSKVKRYMDVHHICYDRACRDWNHLKLLCRSCHITGHRRQKWPVSLGKTLTKVS